MGSCEDEIFKLLQISKFPGQVPYLLTSKRLEKIKDKDFAISLKYDGTRSLLYVRTDGYAFLVNRKGLENPLGKAMKETQTFILDCEVMDSNIVILDLLYPVEKDADLFSRLESGTNLLAEAKLQIPKWATIQKKLYLRKSEPDILQNLNGHREGPTDGYIVTLIDEKKVLKVKDKQTIDFKLGPAREPLIRDKAGHIMDKHCSSILDLPDIAEPGDVVECIVEDSRTFIFDRFRKDKTDANYVSVLNDIFEYFEAPISMENLITMMG